MRTRRKDPARAGTRRTREWPGSLDRLWGRLWNRTAGPSHRSRPGSRPDSRPLALAVPNGLPKDFVQLRHQMIRLDQEFSRALAATAGGWPQTLELMRRFGSHRRLLPVAGLPLLLLAANLIARWWLTP